MRVSKITVSLPSISVLAMKSCKAKRIRSSCALRMVLYYLFCSLYTVESPPIIIPGSFLIQTDSLRALGLLGVSNAGGGIHGDMPLTRRIFGPFEAGKSRRYGEWVLTQYLTVMRSIWNVGCAGLIAF